MTRRTAVGALAVAPFAALAATSPASAAEVKVSIDNFTFNPKAVTVKAGTTVTWTNNDDIPHTVADPPKFRSKALDTGDSYSFTFTTPGAYDYFCSLHPHMTGRIVVEAATGENEAR
jgi:plastocyanin